MIDLNMYLMTDYRAWDVSGWAGHRLSARSDVLVAALWRFTFR
jgi:hypothetical protein